ncbi:acetylglutamate kinase [Sediminibacterium sp. KACHI17]|uniref:Acetylglutamate kinase n=1 Tax=Sediminibacterium sp. KACHI17 TaxID=1751071 RepID=A0AAT9GJH0_9BACT
MEQLFIIKIGGNIIDDENRLTSFLQQFAALKGNKILIHGGGKLATKLAEQMGIQQQMVDGRRITDGETLKIVTMVYAGYINKNIVAKLQSLGENAIGLTGADANLIMAHQRKHASIDYGFVGDIDAVSSATITHMLQQNLSLVVAPITHDGKGQLFNTNADTIAQELAKAMSHAYETTLIYSFEKKGVLKDINDENNVIPVIDTDLYRQLKESNIIFAGMIPKLDNAFAAVNAGVKKVIIGQAEMLQSLVEGVEGTSIQA